MQPIGMNKLNINIMQEGKMIKNIGIGKKITSSQSNINSPMNEKMVFGNNSHIVGNLANCCERKKK